MRAVAAAVLATGATLALAGCGSGTLSHGDFVKQADALCSAYDAKVHLLTKPASYDDIVAYVDQTLPLYVGALDELAKLKPPAADRSAAKTWLTANRKVVTAVRNLRSAAMRHDLAATNDASTAVQAASLTSRQAAAALGLTTCAAP